MDWNHEPCIQNINIVICKSGPRTEDRHDARPEGDRADDPRGGAQRLVLFVSEAIAAAGKNVNTEKPYLFESTGMKRRSRIVRLQQEAVGCGRALFLSPPRVPASGRPAGAGSASAAASA